MDENHSCSTSLGVTSPIQPPITPSPPQSVPPPRPASHTPHVTAMDSTAVILRSRPHDLECTATSHPNREGEPRTATIALWWGGRGPHGKWWWCEVLGFDGLVGVLAWFGCEARLRGWLGVWPVGWSIDGWSVGRTVPGPTHRQRFDSDTGPSEGVTGPPPSPTAPHPPHPPCWSNPRTFDCGVVCEATADMSPMTPLTPLRQ